MTDTSDQVAAGRPPVASQVEVLHRDAVASRDAVRQQLSDLRSQRDGIAAKIKTAVAEEEKLARIVKNLERMLDNGEATTERG